LRAHGKKVIAHLSSPGNRELYLASACDEILADESGPLALTGLAAEVGFYGEALRRVGIDPELEHIGDYKSFSETFTRAEMSPAHREATDAILDGIEGRLLDGIAAGRKITKERARELVDGGPYLPEAAKAAGLADAILYRDQLPERLSVAAGKIVPLEAWIHRRPRWRPLFRKRAIAVLSLEGAIVSGEGSDLLQKTVGAESAVRALSSLRDNPRVAGVVLHVDSRGGSAAASDRIWREVSLLQNKKPVVAYLDDTAASGGYYIVAPTAWIVAQPTTLTGSIGVVAGKFSVERLLDRFGVGTALLTRGRAAAMHSIRRRYDDDGRGRLKAEMAGVYQQFVGKVASGRKMEPARVETLAQGRVWTGHDAKTRGLVDEIGDLAAAVKLAREKSARPGEKLEVRDALVRKQRGGLLKSLSGASLRDLFAPLGERVLLLGDLPTVD
jgi:protease-4